MNRYLPSDRSLTRWDSMCSQGYGQPLLVLLPAFLPARLSRARPQSLPAHLPRAWACSLPAYLPWAWPCSLPAYLPRAHPRPVGTGPTGPHRPAGYPWT